MLSKQFKLAPGSTAVKKEVDEPLVAVADEHKANSMAPELWHQMAEETL
jgi:hypothetical protein